MKGILKTLAIISVFAFSVIILSTGLATAAVVSTSASAEVMVNLAIVQTQALGFGHFVVGTSNGTVAVDSTGTTVTGGVTKVDDGALGAFIITGGTPNSTVTVTVPGSINLVEGNGNNTMATTLQVTGGSSVILDNLGGKNISIQGILTVGAYQPAGTYVGTYNITVNN